MSVLYRFLLLISVVHNMTFKVEQKGYIGLVGKARKCEVQINRVLILNL